MTFTTYVFLTKDELCERLQISRKTLWQWHQDNEAPPSIKIGRRVRYPEHLLDKFFEEQLVA